MGKKGTLTMFIGAVIIAVLMFIDLPLNFGVWATLFIIGMIVAASGAIMSIASLSRKIKEDKVKL